MPSPEHADFFDVVLGQRACRAFAPDPVDDEVVARILEAATHAPSAENSQPWVFVVVRDRERRAQLAQMAAQVWHGWAREYAAPRLTELMVLEVDEGVRSLAVAPVVLVVGGSTEECLPEVLPESVFPAVQNILLAARALGLATALTNLSMYDETFGPFVGFPEHVRPMAIIPIGKPARPLGPPRRRPFTQSTYRERFGDQW